MDTVKNIKIYNLVLYASLAVYCEVARKFYDSLAEKAWKQFGQATQPMVLADLYANFYKEQKDLALETCSNILATLNLEQDITKIALEEAFSKTIASLPPAS